MKDNCLDNKIHCKYNTHFELFYVSKEIESFNEIKYNVWMLHIYKELQVKKQYLYSIFILFKYSWLYWQTVLSPISNYIFFLK